MLLLVGKQRISPTSPDRGFLCPLRIGIALVHTFENVMRQMAFGDVFSVVRTSIAISAPREVKRFWHSGIVWVFSSPVKDLAWQVL
jgi:hypothetical protein